MGSIIIILFHCYILYYRRLFIRICISKVHKHRKELCGLTKSIRALTQGKSSVVEPIKYEVIKTPPRNFLAL